MLVVPGSRWLTVTSWTLVLVWVRPAAELVLVTAHRPDAGAGHHASLRLLARLSDGRLHRRRDGGGALHHRRHDHRLRHRALHRPRGGDGVFDHPADRGAFSLRHSPGDGARHRAGWQCDGPGLRLRLRPGDGAGDGLGRQHTGAGDGAGASDGVHLRLVGQPLGDDIGLCDDVGGGSGDGHGDGCGDGPARGTGDHLGAGDSARHGVGVDHLSGGDVGSLPGDVTAGHRAHHLAGLGLCYHPGARLGHRDRPGHLRGQRGHLRHHLGLSSDVGDNPLLDFGADLVIPRALGDGAGDGDVVGVRAGRQVSVLQQLRCGTAHGSQTQQQQQAIHPATKHTAKQVTARPNRSPHGQTGHRTAKQVTARPNRSPHGQTGHRTADGERGAGGNNEAHTYTQETSRYNCTMKNNTESINTYSR